MAQKRYLTILGTLIYLFMLISLVPILLDFYVSTILSVFSYIAFIFVVIFLLGLFILYVKENAILLHISVVLPVLLSFTDLIYGITTNLMIYSCICQISFLILYFIGVFILKKQKTTPKHKIDFTINTVFWLLGFILFNHLFLVPVALAYLLYEKGVFNKIYATISISVAGIIMMVLFILLSIHFLPFMLILLILLAAYYLLSFTTKGKYLIKTVEEHSETQAEKEVSFDTNIQMLSELYELKETGILTDEEFQTQKDKILGGK